MSEGGILCELKLISYFGKTSYFFVTLKNRTVQHQHDHIGTLVQYILFKHINAVVIGFKAFMAGVAHVVVFLSGHLRGLYVDAHIVDKQAALIPRVTELGSGGQRSDKVEKSDQF